MNRLLLLLLAIITCTSTYAQGVYFQRKIGTAPMKSRAEYTRYQIKGTILNADKARKLHLSGIINREVTLNNDNTFELSGDAYEPGVLIIQGDNMNYCFLWVSDGKTDVTFTEYSTPMRDSAKKYLKIVNLTGPSETETYLVLERRNEELKATYNHIPVPARMDSIAAAIYPEVADYITKNRSSHLALTLLKKYNFPVEQKQALLAKMDRNVNTFLYDDYDETLKRSALLRAGSVFPNFTMELRDGTDFTLYSTVARYILLQFVESESPDCDDLNLQLGQLHSQYHSQGLEIISISLDTRKRSWICRTGKYTSAWKQVLDPKGRKGYIATTYRINTAPFSILLNGQYEVIATDRFLPIVSARIKNLFKQ